MSTPTRQTEVVNCQLACFTTGTRAVGLILYVTVVSPYEPPRVASVPHHRFEAAHFIVLIHVKDHSGPGLR